MMKEGGIIEKNEWKNEYDEEQLAQDIIDKLEDLPCFNCIDDEYIQELLTECMGPYQVFKID